MRSSVMQIGLSAVALFLAACNAPEDQGATEDTVASKASPHVQEIVDGYTLVMLGDSITAGFGLAPDEALPVKLQAALRKIGNKVNVINAGVSGDTTADALARFDWSIGDESDGVFIALGGNDLLQGIDPAQTEQNIRTMIERAKLRDLLVLVAGMRAPGNYGEDYRIAFDALYTKLARDEAVSLYPFLLDGVATDPALNQSDGIHPNEKGVSIIVERLTPFIDAAINETTSPQSAP